VAITNQTLDICTRNCTIHMELNKLTQTNLDIDLCNTFCDEYSRFVKAAIQSLLIEPCYSNTARIISRIVSYLSSEINQGMIGQNNRATMIQKYMLCQGTGELKQISQSDPEVIGHVVLLRVLPLIHVELQDQDFKDTHEMEAEVPRLLADMIFCPRKTLRFFLRRNFCDCLKKRRITI